MKVYFPQWQGSGNGTHIESGAYAILKYLNDSAYHEIDLSSLPAGEDAKRMHCINNYEAITEQLHRFKKHLSATNPETLTIIGGDCGLEIVPVSYLNHRYPSIGVIWFDAHADINRPCDSASCNFHGMPLRTLLGEGEERMDSLLFSKIAETQIHYVGLRDIDEAEQKRLTEGNVYHPKSLNIPELITSLQNKDITHLYLHFDFDCLDPKAYDQTYYQVAEGLQIEEAEAAIRALMTNFTVVGRSVLESITTDKEALTPITGILDLLLKREV